MNIISLIREILKSRAIIWDLAKADFKKRFVGSYFGIAWMFVQPVVTVLIYFLIFQMGFKSTPPEFHMWFGWFRALCHGFSLRRL